MWSMGVVLVFLLAAHNIFGYNIEDGADVLKHYTPQVQLRVAVTKQAEWVRLLVNAVGVLITG